MARVEDGDASGNALSVRRVHLMPPVQAVIASNGFGGARRYTSSSVCADMSTVLVIEDQFLAGYELECLLKDSGYAVRHVATQPDAISMVERLSSTGELVAIICDNRLISGEPAATSLYRAVRRQHPTMPFIVYSGYPPEDLPHGDAQLKIVRKPFADRVLSHVRSFTAPLTKGRPAQAPRHRKAA